jgi:[citrate (pro-3S)-lyase] ligase
MLQSMILSSQLNQYLNALSSQPDAFCSWIEATKATLQEHFDSLENLSCLVFNANPYTLGHDYLLSLASKRSSAVVVFVIEGKPDSGCKGNHESTTFEIPFEDRLKLVQQCAQKYPNVLVLPAGPFLIGRNSFPQNWTQDWSTEEKGKSHLYAILDAQLFFQLIAPQLGIKTRYVGDEPRDEMSEMHLNALRQESKLAKIPLRVAERKRLGDKYISSSMVREALAQGAWETVQATVPDYVYQYLKQS